MTELQDRSRRRARGGSAGASSSPRRAPTTPFSTGRCRTSCSSRRSISPRWGRPARQYAADARPLPALARRPRSGCARRCRPATSTRPWPRRWSPSPPTTSSFTSICRFCSRTPTRKSWFVGKPAFAEQHRVPERHAAGRLSHPGAAGASASTPARWPASTTPRSTPSSFPDGKVKSNVLINIGYGDDAKLFPRNPRLAFDQMAKIL